MDDVHVCIMAGGKGTRFWPASTEALPKQFLDILGTGKSLLQGTYDRFIPLTDPAHMWVLTNERYAGIVREQLPQVDVHNVLLEPAMRNTAPALAYAAFKLYHRDPDAVMLATPSDQVILREEVFRLHVKRAARFAAEQDALLTLGIRPTRPATGYGYIERGDAVEDAIYKVQRFVEKPDAETARAFLETGNFLWNAGMFLWRVSTFLEALEQYAPDIYRPLQEGPYDTDDERDWIRRIYPDLPNISIDYALMEKADNVYTIPLDVGWSDLGSWNALYDFMKTEEGENICMGGRCHLDTCTGNLIYAPELKGLALKGLRDYAVVYSRGYLLIYPRRDEQEIKDVQALFREGDL